MKKKNIKEFLLSELEEIFIENGLKKFNAVQLYEWLYKKRVRTFDEMTNLSKDLRGYLSEHYVISGLKLLQKKTSADGTLKFVFGLNDGNVIETVMIPEPKRRTLCVSTQIGCRRKCAFCVSGKGRFVRDLSAAEIVDQVLSVDEQLEEGKVTNIVFMGIGEPLDNYDNLFRAIDIIREGRGIYIGKRKISISTCGIVPAIERMIKEKRDIRLSVSLHSADDNLRSGFMPVNRQYPLDVLFKALRRFSAVFGFPVFFEYILIKDLNSSRDDAFRLAQLLRGTSAKVNLIPYNESSFKKWQAPEPEQIREFCAALEKKKIFYTLRRSRGADIGAACGQLRAQTK